MSKKRDDTTAIVLTLQETLKQLVEQSTKVELTSHARRKLELEIRTIIDDLGKFLNELDPIQQPTSVFDPSNPKIVGRFVSLALVAQPRHPQEG